MNILVCGKKTPFTELLFERLHKERNELYFLSGSPASERIGRFAFQQYDFAYTNKNISRIVSGCNPDCMVILGAADMNFVWRKTDQDSSEYISGIAALLVAAQTAGISNVIYISNIDVFEQNEEEVLTKESIPIAQKARLASFVRAEELCGQFNDEKMKITILRLPEIFGYDDENSSEFILRSTRSYLRKGKITCAPDRLHSAMFYSDAVEAILRVLAVPDKERELLYQLKGITYTENQPVNLLLESGRKKGATVEKITDDGTKFPYPPANITEFDEEKLGFSLRYDLRSGIDKLLHDCMRYQKRETLEDGWMLNVLPVLEAIVICIACAVATRLLASTWVGENVYLFILYVILFGAVYGTPYALFTSLLSVIAVFVLRYLNASFKTTSSNYQFFLSFLVFVVAGVIAGYMRDKFYRRNRNLEEEKNYYNSELSDLSSIYEDNEYVKDVYEKRLTAYENSLSKIYELTDQLDYLESKKVVFRTVKVVQDLLEMKDVAVYVASRRSAYFRLAAASTGLAASCGKSLRFDKECFLYDAVSRQEIYQNREFDTKLPSFGGGVYTDGDLSAIILVWTDDLRQVNLYKSDMLALICRLAEKSMARAEMYEESIRVGAYVEGTNILNSSSFDEILDTYKEGQKQGLFSYTMLCVELREGMALETVSGLVRDTDVLGLKENCIYIILAYSEKDDAEYVIRRFASKGIEAVITEDSADRAAAEDDVQPGDSLTSEEMIAAENSVDQEADAQAVWMSKSHEEVSDDESEKTETAKIPEDIDTASYDEDADWVPDEANSGSAEESKL